jgi:hypothetical protein
MTRGLLAAVPFAVFSLFALANCSSGDKSATGPESGEDTTTANGHIATCRPTCAKAADCASNGPLQDANHYTCAAGRCEWKGCASDAECGSAGMGNFVCRTMPGADIPTCVPGCQKASDCVPPNAAANPLADASHFACNAGACEWKGCKSNNECATAFKSSRMVCEQPEGAPGKTCVTTCSTAADCAIPGAPLSDKTHFACKAGRCEWLGCKSTQDCKSALMSNRVVCE